MELIGSKKSLIYRQKLDCFCYLFQVVGRKTDCISFYNSFNVEYKESFNCERYGRKTKNLFVVYSNKKLQLKSSKHDAILDVAKSFCLDIMINYASFLDARDGKYGKCTGIYSHYDENGNQIKDECPEIMYLGFAKEAVNYWADLYDDRNKTKFEILNREFAEIYGTDAINDVFFDIDRKQRIAIAEKRKDKRVKKSTDNAEEYLVKLFLESFIDDESCFYDFLDSLRFDVLLVKEYGID